MSDKYTVPRIKIVLVGDGATGKTSLLQRFADGTFNEEYVPTIFENQAKKIHLDGKEVELTLWDTAGQEDYDTIRTLAYKDVDMILLLCSYDHQFSLINVRERWLPELKEHNGNVPIFLVAAKSDLKDDVDSKVKYSDIIDVQKEIKAASFAECSALTGFNVVEVFERAARIVVANRANGDKVKMGCTNILKSCSIM